MAFLFSKSHTYFLFERPYCKGFFSLFAFCAGNGKKKKSLSLSLYTWKKKKFNESSLTKEAPEMKVKITCRKSAERVCGNTRILHMLLLHYCHKWTMFFSEEWLFTASVTFQAPNSCISWGFSGFFFKYLLFFWPWPLKCLKQTSFRVKAGWLEQVIQVMVLVPRTAFWHLWDLMHLCLRHSQTEKSFSGLSKWELCRTCAQEYFHVLKSFYFPLLLVPICRDGEIFRSVLCWHFITLLWFSNTNRSKTFFLQWWWWVFKAYLSSNVSSRHLDSNCQIYGPPEWI